MTIALMVALYSILFHPWDPSTLIGRAIAAYVKLIAALSAWLLAAAGEPVTLHGTTVTGRFPYVVVLDCAALDAQALFAAAVVAFPAKIWARLVGLAGGLSIILLVNVLRLIGLYYAGTCSIALFHALHQEVLVMLIILFVSAMFAAWALWASRLERERQRTRVEPARV